MFCAIEGRFVVTLSKTLSLVICLRYTGTAAMQATPDDLRLSSTLAHLYRQTGMTAKAEALERQGTGRPSTGQVLPDTLVYVVSMSTPGVTLH